MTAAPDDKELMLRYRAGDVGAFEVLYGRYKGPLYRFMLRQCRDPEIAADLFQEVWSRVIGARERYVPTARFNTWLFHIAHNCFIDHYRGRRRRPLEAAGDGALDCAEDPSAGPEARAAVLERADRLRAALCDLPVEQREAFLLREELGMSLQEIGAATGTGRETAKSRLRYAVERLRRALSEDDERG
ncbi:MAG TPA: RNA polymerase sigma factor [Gammaproteobacteria bacterium]|nr:RNA polymerase sigma factor [Gammaproteobacteria bacterium]